MNNRERDLIAALAEGSLADETEARALLQSSPEARKEYEAQTRALSILSDTGTAELTDVERAALHRDLWSELTVGGGARRRRTGLYRWALAAAGLFVVVGLAAVLGQGIGGEDAAESADTVSQALRQERAADGASETTAAAADEFADEAEEEAAAAADAPESAQFLAAEASRLREEGTEADYTPTQAHIECLEEAGLEDFQPIALIGPEQGATAPEGYLAAIPADTTLGPDVPLFLVEASSCEVAYSDG